jgi:hypothetical protein
LTALLCIGTEPDNGANIPRAATYGRARRQDPVNCEQAEKFIYGHFSGVSVSALFVRWL